MNTTPASPEAALQLEIAALVADFEVAMRIARDRVPGVFQRFCFLAQTWRLNPEEFRSRLVRAGLPPSRASEIKAVLSVADLGAAFVSGKLPWREALRQARARLHAQAGLGPIEELVAEIVATMHRNGLTEFQMEYGTFKLRPLEFSLEGENTL